MYLKQIIITILILGIMVDLACAVSAPREIFSDDFGVDSRGELQRNTVSDPPPLGMGYKTAVPQGYRLKQWIIADSEPNGPRRSFWVVPKRTDGTVDTFAEQAGRSHDSIAYVRKPIPSDAWHYRIEFRQWLNDNDYVGYILGASLPVIEHNGIEFGYERQIPGTDQTVPDIYYRGALGRGCIRDRAGLKRWVTHTIEVRGQHLRWSQDGEVLLAGAVSNLCRGGYFGIRQRYERGTRYDGVCITILARKSVTVTSTNQGVHHVATVNGATWNAVDQRPQLEGWSTVALLPEETKAVPYLQWWSALPREEPARLRIAIAVADMNTRTIEVVFGESGQSAGTIQLKDTAMFQTLDLKLSRAQARRAVGEGLRLYLHGGTGPLWMLWRYPEPGAEEFALLPQLLQ